MADQELDPSTPSSLYMLSAFLAMEPAESLVAFARYSLAHFATHIHKQHTLANHSTCLAYNTIANYDARS